MALMDSLTFLQSAAKAKPRPIYVLHGDEHFLKRRVLAALRAIVLGPEDDGFGMSNRDGDKASWAEIHDELETLPFLSPRRLVVIDRADPFVTRERPRLEKYFAERWKPGVWVSDVHWGRRTRSWPSCCRKRRRSFARRPPRKSCRS